MDRSTPYDLGNAKHRKELDGLSIEAVCDIFGEPRITPEWDMPLLRHWQPGQPRPLFADDDPAVMQAIGRCAAARQHRSMFPFLTVAHPAECGWCSDSLEDLLAACDWATFEGRTQTAEWLTWSQLRDGQTSVYQRRLSVERRSQRHADFWALPPDKRTERIVRAQIGGVQ